MTFKSELIVAAKGSLTETQLARIEVAAYAEADCLREMLDDAHEALALAHHLLVIRHTERQTAYLRRAVEAGQVVAGALADIEEHWDEQEPDAHDGARITGMQSPEARGGRPDSGAAPRPALP